MCLREAAILMGKIDRINLILHNSLYRQYLNKNKECEKKRCFCLHDLQHFLDVARIAYIISLEKNMNIKKDIIYGAALLHDIGRWKQYEYNIPHDEASAELSIDILKASEFDVEEINMITEAIKNHRNKENNSELGCLLYTSDKLSRKCFDCSASSNCNWSMDKRNLQILY